MINLQKNRPKLKKSFTNKSVGKNLSVTKKTFDTMAVDYTLYHPKWTLITHLIRFRRAQGKCERCSCEHAKPHRSTNYRVSLATVHLNHDRTNNRFQNLAAFCQGCHMWWDHKRHMYNRKYGKETCYRNGVLFSVEEMNIVIPKLENRPQMMSLFKQDMTGSLRWKTLFDN